MPKKKKEDLNQTAARIARETRNAPNKFPPHKKGEWVGRWDFRSGVGDIYAGYRLVASVYKKRDHKLVVEVLNAYFKKGS